MPCRTISRYSEGYALGPGLYLAASDRVREKQVFLWLGVVERFGLGSF